MPEAHNIYLALGTNLGQREHNLRTALQKLTSQVYLLALSRLYETAPAYVPDQPNFLNMVIQGRTNLSPQDLLLHLKQIEDEMGREKTVRYGPRNIDLDIIFYSSLIVDRPDLQIPHPRMVERGFVLYPLADIASDTVHPVLGQTVADLAAGLSSDAGILQVFDCPWSLSEF